MEPTATTSRVPATPPSIPVAAPSTLPQELAGVDRHSADAVAAAVVRLWFGWDTTVDTSPYDAKLRAVPLLEPGVVTRLRTYPPISGPGADWLELTARSAVARVAGADVRAGVEAGAPPDTSVSAARLLEVTQHIDTPAGPLPDRHLVVAVVLTTVLGEWRVAEVAPR